MRLHVAFSAEGKAELEGVQKEFKKPMSVMLIAAAKLLRELLAIQRGGGTLFVLNKDGSKERLRLLF